ncbi:TauD/TfdA family dioxygenase [Burkholderia cepacia]|uniref:Gamma-butyrobetaine dioxygenase n=2 Tax=Burkholderiaceae TaxID=119060 RepID=A0A9W3K6H8_BURCE|nr:TauD/TfdA family dioxygenase [Burkholderia cepacia]AFQ51110.1 putative gamma-butyrobetaine dioxygenase [Burkholderia cepacia GG4]
MFTREVIAVDCRSELRHKKNALLPCNFWWWCADYGCRYWNRLPSQPNQFSRLTGNEKSPLTDITYQGRSMASLSFHIDEASGRIDIVSDSQVRPVNALWLRERAQDTGSLDPITQQRLFDPHMMDPELRIVKVVRLDNGEIRVTFSDGYTGSYSTSIFLAEFDSSDGLPRAEPWMSDLDQSRIRFSYLHLDDDRQRLLAMEAYLRFGAIILQDVPTDPERILEVAEKFGHVRVTNFGRYFEVYSRPNSNDLAYRPVRLGPHTDNPYREPVPGIQLLHCLINETSGGDSTLVDSLSVLRDLAHEDPTGVDLLAKISVKFRFLDGDTELIERRPMIELDHLKRPTGVHYSPRLDYLPLMDAVTTVAFHRARMRLGEMFSDPRYELRFRLQAGELMMFDNNRVLHGRTAFDPNEGRRHLQGCYIDLDGPRGRYKSLARRLAGCLA